MSVEQSDINKISQVCNEEGTVLFIGSGISAWSGLPSWFGLIKELAEFLKDEGYPYEAILNEAKSNLLTAAGLGVQQLSKQQFKTFIRKACRVGESEPHRIHEKIVNLGPRSFITTNYDKLLEESLRFYKKDNSFQVVTNRQPIDCASIVQIRERDFIFKPHGDIDDTESIILTHEQYRKLYGERNHTLKALETILLTRPIVFIGFSLNDPDFLNIKDNIENTFKGGGQHHYAIMADVNDEKQKYYLDTFGIRIINYNTKELPDGTRDYSSLYDLLDNISNYSERPLEKEILKDNTLISPKLNDSQILSLLRYALGLSNNMASYNVQEFPILVKTEREEIHKHLSVIDLLKDENERRVLLLGNPGDGKTYSFKKLCFEISNKLHEDLVSESNQKQKFIVPIFVDLKLYDGDILNMIQKTLPHNISLEHLVNSEKCLFILDSFNEISKEIFESGSYKEDFDNFFRSINNSKVVIGSRNKEGINFHNLSEYRIDGIPYEFVESYIKNNNLCIEKRLFREIISLLQKPFFFKLLVEGKISVNNLKSPTDIYTSFFYNINYKFNNEFNQKVDLTLALKSIAFFSINQGKEVLKVQEVLSKLKISLKTQSKNETSAEKVLDWLIKEEIIIPMPNARLSFFHQSITEYLAAMELSTLYRVSPEILEECLIYTRWDQALFLTVGFLNENEATQFIEQVLEKDIVLALNATKYIEYKSENIVTSILDFIINNISTFKNKLEFNIDYPLKSMTVTELHEPQLRLLLNEGNLFGKVAMELLYKIKGKSMKNEILDLLIKNCKDFNFVSYLDRILKNDIEISDIKYLISEIKDYNKEDISGLQITITNMLATFEIEEINSIFLKIEELTDIEIEIYCETLKEICNEYAIGRLIDLIHLKKESAIFNLYLIIEDIEFDKDILNEKLIIDILSFITEKAKWCVGLLITICSLKPELRIYLQYLNTSKSISKIERLVIFYVLNNTGSESFWIEYEEFIKNPIVSIEIIVAFDELDWTNREEIISFIFERKDIKLFGIFLKSVRHNPNFEFHMGLEEIKELLNWLENIESSGKTSEEFYWILELTKEFIISHTEKSIQKEIVQLFDSEDCPFRMFVEQVVFELPSVTTDSLSEDTIQFCINNLYRKRYSFHTINIGQISTESFVQNKLMPLLSQSNEVLRFNLQEVLRQAGNAHKKRYIQTLI